MTQTSWDVEHARRVGSAIKAIRGERSAQWLSDETDKVGHKVTRSTIADIENGRRKYVSTAELSVLAWVLGVPPSNLLYPDLPDGPVEAVPAESMSSIEAVMWFSGEMPRVPDVESPTFKLFGGLKGEAEFYRDSARVMEVFEGSRLVALSRERVEVEGRIQTLTGLVADMREAGDEETAAHFAKEVVTLMKQKDAINRDLRGRGGAVVGDGG